MTGPAADVGRIRKIARCKACGGKVPVEGDQLCLNCPLCGLAVLRGPGAEELHSMAVPRADRENCWRSLAGELSLPAEVEATEVRSARLLLVPYWRLVDEARRSVTRRGVVVSAADLTPVGLPPLTLASRNVRGLAVEEVTRTGDGMGRLPAGPPPFEASPVDLMLQPPGATPGASAGTEWRLVYYPLWSFHYVVYSKEHYHMVDAVTATPIGPARRVRWGTTSGVPAATMLLVHAAGAPLIGAAAALPAWGAALAAMRLLIRRQRGG